MADPFIGQIQTYGFNFAPRGWALCNGQLLAISSHTALFSLLGTYYGGDGRTTFALPDMRGRVATHFGTGPGLTPRSLAQRFGTENAALNAHTHTVAPGCVTVPGDETSPSGGVPANAGTAGDIFSTDPPTAAMRATTSSSAGAGNGNGANMQPTLVINWCIALVGTYPSRN